MSCACLSQPSVPDHLSVWSFQSYIYTSPAYPGSLVRMGCSIRTIGATAPLDAVYKATVPQERWRFGLNRASHTGKGSNSLSISDSARKCNKSETFDCVPVILFFSRSSSPLSSNSLTFRGRQVKEQKVSFNNKPRHPIT